MGAGAVLNLKQRPQAHRIICALVGAVSLKRRKITCQVYEKGTPVACSGRLVIFLRFLLFYIEISAYSDPTNVSPLCLAHLLICPSTIYIS